MKRAALILAVLLCVPLAMGLAGSLATAKDFTITCDTDGEQVKGGDGFSSVYCDNNSSTSVFIGGVDVDTTGLCISKDTANCPRRDLPGDFGYGALYCKVASGTQAIHCLAGK